MSEVNNLRKRNTTTRRAGRTIIIRKKEADELPIKELSGIVNSTSVDNGKHFLTFDTIENSKKAFRILKNNASFNVRFAYYKIFFTMTGITDNQDYSELKKLHSTWITQNSDAEVLYYKQYMKNTKYLGCGDFTVDTKESMDKLISKDGLKNYTIDTLSGTFYRYNRKQDKQDKQVPDLV